MSGGRDLSVRSWQVRESRVRGLSCRPPLCISARIERCSQTQMEAAFPEIAGTSFEAMQEVTHKPTIKDIHHKQCLPELLALVSLFGQRL